MQDPATRVQVYTGEQTTYRATFARAYMCRVRGFRKDKAGQSSNSKTRIRPYMRMTSCRAWARGLSTIFSAYIVIKWSDDAPIPS